MHMVRMFDVNFLATFVQWINTKDIKLYVNSKNVLEQFKKMFSENIGLIVKKIKTKW